jgi:hypothetical protein
MPTETIQPIQEILNRWILIGQALVGSIGALAFVIAFLWTKIGLFKAQTFVTSALTTQQLEGLMSRPHGGLGSGNRPDRVAAVGSRGHRPAAKRRLRGVTWR